MLKKMFGAVIYPILGLGVAAMFVVGLRKSGWTFHGWIRDVVEIVWPVAFIFGLLFLLAAHATKATGTIEEAYPFMRRAAISFLVSAFTLWLVFRGII